MITTPDVRETKTNHAMRGGEGSIDMTALFTEKIPHLRMLNIAQLEPGASIGLHKHEAESEVYFVLEGECTVFDEGEYKLMRSGDAHLCRDGGEHMMKNTGTGLLRVLAIIPTLAE